MKLNNKTVDSLKNLKPQKCVSSTSAIHISDTEDEVLGPRARGRPSPRRQVEMITC